MKPHLKFALGLWFCINRKSRVERIGTGYTPAQAYADWQGARLLPEEYGGCGNAGAGGV